MGVYFVMNLVPANPSRGFCHWLALVALLLLAAGCATGGGGNFSGNDGSDRARSASARTSGSVESAPAPAAQRPGLGTEFGEERESRVHLSRFVRANGDRPLATTAVFYDDASGVRAQTDGSDGGGGFSEPPPSARGLVELTLRDGESGFALPTRMAGGRRLVTGKPGKRYVVEVRNRTDARVEVVLSVDGLDAIDGRPAGYGKPGYILAPGGRVRVEGFRQSLDTVAAFRFAAVRDSYAAQRYGDTRNVGVIGAAVFGERGRLPFGGGDEETERRRRADPFPGQGRFAEPPPRRY